MFTFGDGWPVALRPLPGAVLAALLAFPMAASARSILVIAPHPDDETLIAGGRLRAAIQAGDTATIAVMTNGDILGVQSGLLRETESVAAARRLGLTEPNVIFLGYGDSSLMSLYQSASGTQVLTSQAGANATYAAHGLGGTDYHSTAFGSPAPYSRNSVVQDLEALLAALRPDEIYTTSPIDEHPDHAATGQFVMEALVALERQGQALPTRLYWTVVWVAAPPSGLRWPQLNEAGFSPVPFDEPDCCIDQSVLAWSRIQRFPVPLEMQSADPSANLKFRAIQDYQSQITPWLTSWARKDEFFWRTDVGANRAFTATLTASSQNVGGEAVRAADGLADGAHSWSSGQGAGAWIQLSWPSPVTLSEVDLQDQVVTWNNVLAGTLTFSDGSSVPVGALPVGGQVLPVPFAPRTVSWVRFTVSSVTGTSGLAEMAALGPAPGDDTPPVVVYGPIADLDPIYPWETALFTMAGADPDGDPLSVVWSADGGTVQGTGATAVFQPPAVASPTIFTISAQILDGRGGANTNTGIVTVLPSFDGIGLQPAQLPGGGSAQGIVTLASPAPPGGLVVPLSSNSPWAVLPSSVAIPAGQLSGSFTVTTAPVGTTVQASVSAQLAGGVQTASLLVFPPLGSTNLAPRAAVTVSSQASGQPGTAAVDGVVDGFPSDGSKEWAASGTSGQWIQLGWPTPVFLGGVILHDRINLTDQILAGRLQFSDGTTVQVGTLPDDGTGLLVRFPERTVTSVRLTVDSVNGYNTGLAELEAFSPLSDTLSLSPAAVGGGGSAQGTVALAAPAASGGAVIPLSSSDPAASVPASVTVPAGSTVATFPVATQLVSQPHAAVIAAAFPGGTRSATLTIAPVTIGALTLSPASLLGGGGALGSVQLSVAAPAALAVALASSNPSVVVPATVTVAAGATSATFPVFTAAVSSLTQATVTATLGASQAFASLTLSPAPGDANLALSARATASSEATASGQTASKAIDGIVDGYPNDFSREWATNGQLAGAWIQLDWPGPVTLEEARLFDRPNLDDHVLSGHLLFSDGTTVAVAALPNDASSPSLVDFAPRTVSWVRFVVDSAAGFNIGLAELELFGPNVPSTSFTASPPSVKGGGLVTGTVDLGTAAPAGGTAVALASSDPSLPVPASLTLAAGAHSATFTALAGAVSAPTAVTLTASLPGGARTALVTVQPPGVAALAVAPASVTEGAPAGGTVTLDSPAGPGGMAVQLASSVPAVVVPATVAVAAGQTTASFTASTGAVGSTTTAQITASAGGASATGALTVNPVLVASLSVSPATVAGGSATQGTVTLASPGIGTGAVVALSSSDGSAQVPASVTVAPGATSATFAVTTLAVGTTRSVILTASRGGTSATAGLTVAAPSLLSAFSLAATSVVGGSSTTGQITLSSAAPPGGLPVSLSSGNAAATVPASVTVAAGATSATFTVRTTTVTADTAVTLSASQAGVTLTAATLTVQTARPRSLSLSPSTVTATQTSTGTIRLTGAAPAGGKLVALSSGNAAATVPPSVTVAAGATTATFPIQTSPVTANTTVPIAASASGTSVQANLSVRLLAVSGVSLGPSSVTGGSTSTGTVTLTRAALSGGFTVALSSSQAAATVPASVTVAAGATTATFPITTTAVTLRTTSSISASGGGVTRSATLTINP